LVEDLKMEADLWLVEGRAKMEMKVHKILSKMLYHGSNGGLATVHLK
jgi:hypothetical protein